MAVGSIRGFLDCRLPCCRFRTIQDRTEWAGEHSLRTRVAEAADLAGLAPTMRAPERSTQRRQPHDREVGLDCRTPPHHHSSDRRLDIPRAASIILAEGCSRLLTADKRVQATK